MTKIKAIRGMNDVLPVDTPLWLRVESVCAEVFNNYNYKQIRTPILESTQLFARTLGADTDVVVKEMYTFADRNGDSLTLRPEGTASTARSGIENGLFYNQQQRLWYIGPMFRHERPQKGRYRQFHQIGAEAYGWSTPDIEAQMLSMLVLIWQRLGLQKTQLQINSLGDAQTRQQYRTALVDYLTAHRSQLDDDSLRRLDTNPLRILDSKHTQTQQLLIGAPSILDFLSTDSKADFALLQTYLDELGIVYTVNPRLVRGLDYYNKTVFEWINEDFGAQSTVCGGGRYDGLVEQLGGASISGFGFSIGLERLVQILQEQQAEITTVIESADVFIISVGEQARQQALLLCQSLTAANLKVQLHCGEGSMKNQFKKADKSSAKLALIIGEDEADQAQVTVKKLLVHGDQMLIPQKRAVGYVTNCLGSL